MTIKPKNIEELAICLAIIRPAAKKARDSTDYKNSFIFDDDAIEIIEQLMDCNEDTAEMYRKGYIKKNTQIMNTLKNLRPLMPMPMPPWRILGPELTLMCSILMWDKLITCIKPV